jgi:hypothetical protein
VVEGLRLPEGRPAQQLAEPLRGARSVVGDRGHRVGWRRNLHWQAARSHRDVLRDAGDRLRPARTPEHDGHQKIAAATRRWRLAAADDSNDVIEGHQLALLRAASRSAAIATRSISHTEPRVGS